MSMLTKPSWEFQAAIGLLLMALAGVAAGQTTYYADASRPDDSGDGLTWSTAKKTIQAAVDLASGGDMVLVTNGLYDTGGALTPGYALTNRVGITKAITVRAVSTNPALTVIKGQGPSGLGAVRCAYLTNGASLIGFTLTNGHTLLSGNATYEMSGGGGWMFSTNCTVSNCAIIGNSAATNGGGVYRGTLNNCTLSGNSTYRGGGTYLSTLNRCTLSGNSASDDGGGAYQGTLNRCTLSGNSASDNGGGTYLSTLNNCTLWANSAARGGGAYSATLNNCILSGNSASDNGGGAVNSTLNNCVLWGNSANNFGGGANLGTLNNCTLSENSGNNGGGARAATLNNCIAWGNTAGANGQDIYQVVAVRYSCASDGVTNGVDGCITNNPMFVDAAVTNLRLKAGSLCIDAGNNAYVQGTNDVDGALRIRYDVVDMGAYEYEQLAPQGTIIMVR